VTSSPRRSVLAWTGAICVLVVVTSVAGLIDSRVYAQETENWTLQARGQDLGNLLAAVVLAVAALRLRAGSSRAGLVWLGTLLYFVYAFVVYAFAVHFGYLFLAYVAVLGLSAWCVILHFEQVRSASVDHPDGRRRTFAAWVLVVTGAVFALLWLSEVVPAILGGTVPASLTEAGLVVNPIHVIDLALVLPAFVLTGVTALRDREAGLFWLAPWLVFSVLMGSSIVAAMVLIMTTGASDTAVPMVGVSVLVVVSLVAVVGYLRGPRGSRTSARA
jgi:hypothetical protein